MLQQCFPEALVELGPTLTCTTYASGGMQPTECGTLCAVKVSVYVDPFKTA